MHFSNANQPTRAHAFHHLLYLGSHALGHSLPPLGTPGTSARELEMAPVPQNSLKLLKLVNPKSTFTLPLSCKKHSKNSRPQFPSFLTFWPSPQIFCVTSPLPQPSRHGLLPSLKVCEYYQAFQWWSSPDLLALP